MPKSFAVAVSTLLLLGAAQSVCAADAAPQGAAVAAPPPAAVAVPSKRAMHRMVKERRADEPRAGITAKEAPRASQRTMRKKQREAPAPGSSTGPAALANAV